MKLKRGRLFDHIHLKVKDIKRSKEFYQPLVESLGLSINFENDECFCIDELLVSESPEPTHAIHLAFQAEHPAAVKLFYETGLKYGGRCNGGPGTRTQQMGYYSAYVLDPDGNNIEAVFHGPNLYAKTHIEMTYLR